MNETTTSLALIDDVVTDDLLSSAITSSFYQQFGKRLLDLTLVIPLFLLSLPAMAVVGLAILMTSGWPVFYGSERLWKDGHTFRTWKFRTMVRDADQVLQHLKDSHPALAEEYSKNFKLKHDPRVTGLGRVLRKSALDELPQFWNVLRGQMSLVGPRPYIAHELAPYSKVRQAILTVTPGITGPWQVGGRNGLLPLTRMQLDVEYASGVRLKKDIMYLLSTIATLAQFNGS